MPPLQLLEAKTDVEALRSPILDVHAQVYPRRSSGSQSGKELGHHCAPDPMAADVLHQVNVQVRGVAGELGVASPHRITDDIEQLPLEILSLRLRSSGGVARLDRGPPLTGRPTFEGSSVQNTKGITGRRRAIVCDQGELGSELEVGPDIDVAEQAGPTHQLAGISSGITRQQANRIQTIGIVRAEVPDVCARHSSSFNVGRTRRDGSGADPTTIRAWIKAVDTGTLGTPQSRKGDPVTKASQIYLDELVRLLTDVRSSQEEAIFETATLVANTVTADGIIHIFGTGHSHILAEEIFYRAGGLAQVNPILVDPLMLHAGAAQSTQLERLPGLAEAILDGVPTGPHDVMIVVSNSGGNAVAVEMALAAKRRKMPTVAVTSLGHATHATARHQEGKRLHEVVDVVLDNRGRPGDACVSFDGMELAVAPTSTAVGSALLNAVVAEAVEIVLARGETPDVFASSNMEGGDRINQDLIERYSSRVRAL